MTGGKPDCPAAVSKSQAWRGKPPCQSTNHYKHFGPLVMVGRKSEGNRSGYLRLDLALENRDLAHPTGRAYSGPFPLTWAVSVSAPL